MKNLLYKEIKLVTHPTTLIFLGLSAMMLIPNYPYYVTFFYATLGIFFTCLNGRENHDIFYTMTLPICKKDIVRARFAFVGLVELLQVLCAIPFALLRRSFASLPNNAVGMEANIPFFGLSLVMLGLFNFVFFVRYYKDPSKVGSCFTIGSIVVFVYMLIAEALTHIIPFLRDKMDTNDFEYLGAKLCMLAVGLVIYLALTLIAYVKSVKSFEQLDL